MRAAHPRVVLGLHRSRHERTLLTAAADLGISAIDTSTNYIGFQSHKTLAQRAGDLLPKFTLSTKVGYFPTSGGSEHSLDPDRLTAAVEGAVQDLGREPGLVFLHNPEHSLTRAGDTSAADRLAEACSALMDAVERGLCGGWGISSWDPRPLVVSAGGQLLCPDVLMVRAGLLVGVDVLEAAEQIAERWQPTEVWGMSPFGGSTTEPVWERFDPRTFMRAPQACTPAQAAFRTAFHLPAIDRIAVSTSNPQHLRDLIESVNHEVDQRTIDQYRGLLLDSRQED